MGGRGDGGRPYGAVSDHSGQGVAGWVVGCIVSVLEKWMQVDGALHVYIADLPASS